MHNSARISTLLTIICLLLVIFTPLTISAQIDSPYSRYGLGKLVDFSSGPSKGMGGIGYGISHSPSPNPLNPASYATVDSLTFVFDMGVNYTNTTFKDQTGKYSKSGGGVEYITALFPLSKQLGLSVGLLPFTKVGYKMGGDKYTEEVGNDGEKIPYHVDHTGEGGLSRVYLGLGYDLPIKGLRAGFNVSYLFGKLTYTNQVTNITGYETGLPSEQSTLNVTTAKVDLGLQYSFPVTKTNILTLGLVYSPKINGTGKLKRLLYEANGVNTEPIDLINERVNTGLPNSFGFGFTYTMANKILVGADFGYEKWKDARFTDLLGDGMTSSDRFNNRKRVAVGFEYRNAVYSRKYLDKVKFRAGFNYTDSYVNVNVPTAKAKGYDEYGASVGVGLPISDREGIGNRTSYVNISFEYKYLKPQVPSMVTEKFFGISLNMNFSEFWFFQRKIN